MHPFVDLSKLKTPIVIPIRITHCEILISKFSSNWHIANNSLSSRITISYENLICIINFVDHITFCPPPPSSIDSGAESKSITEKTTLKCLPPVDTARRKNPRKSIFLIKSHHVHMRASWYEKHTEIEFIIKYWYSNKCI